MIPMADEIRPASKTRLSAALVAAGLALGAGPALAQRAPAKPPPAGGPTLLQESGAWGAYSANAGKAKTCYALGKPRDRQPASLKRDPAYVFISHRPGEGVKNEVSIVMGFDVKPDSSPKAEIGGSSFDMVAKGANLWVKNPAEEGQFLDALRKSQRLVVKAVSKKGNATTDSYALSGIQPALERIGRECQ